MRKKAAWPGPRVVANITFSHHHSGLDLQNTHPKIVYLLFWSAVLLRSYHQVIHSTGDLELWFESSQCFEDSLN